MTPEASDGGSPASTRRTERAAILALAFCAASLGYVSWPVTGSTVGRTVGAELHDHEDYLRARLPTVPDGSSEPPATSLSPGLLRVELPSTASTGEAIRVLVGPATSSGLTLHDVQSSVEHYARQVRASPTEVDFAVLPGRYAVHAATDRGRAATTLVHVTSTSGRSIRLDFSDTRSVALRLDTAAFAQVHRIHVATELGLVIGSPSGRPPSSSIAAPKGVRCVVYGLDAEARLVAWGVLSAGSNSVILTDNQDDVIATGPSGSTIRAADDSGPMTVRATVREVLSPTDRDHRLTLDGLPSSWLSDAHRRPVAIALRSRHQGVDLGGLVVDAALALDGASSQDLVYRSSQPPDQVLVAGGPVPLEFHLSESRSHRTLRCGDSESVTIELDSTDLSGRSTMQEVSVFTRAGGASASPIDDNAQARLHLPSGQAAILLRWPGSRRTQLGAVEVWNLGGGRGSEPALSLGGQSWTDSTTVVRFHGVDAAGTTWHQGVRGYFEAPRTFQACTSDRLLVDPIPPGNRVLVMRQDQAGTYTIWPFNGSRDARRRALLVGRPNGALQFDDCRGETLWVFERFEAGWDYLIHLDAIGDVCRVELPEGEFGVIRSSPFGSAVWTGRVTPQTTRISGTNSTKLEECRVRVAVRGRAYPYESTVGFRLHDRLGPSASDTWRIRVHGAGGVPLPFRELVSSAFAIQSAREGVPVDLSEVPESGIVDVQMP